MAGKQFISTSYRTLAGCFILADLVNFQALPGQRLKVDSMYRTGSVAATPIRVAYVSCLCSLPKRS